LSIVCIEQDKQEIQCALNERQNELPQAAFALELLELLEPAVGLLLEDKGRAF